VPGFKFSVFSYLMSLLHPRSSPISNSRNMDMRCCRRPICSGRFRQGLHRLRRRRRQDAEIVRAFLRQGPAIYPEFDAYLMDSVKIMRKILLETPPDPSCRDWRPSRRRRIPVEIPRVGGKLFRLVDLFTMSADDYLSECSSAPRSRRCWPIIAASHFCRAKEPGSAYVVLHHLMGEHAGAGGWVSCARHDRSLRP